MGAAWLESGTADSDLGKRNAVVSSEVVQTPGTVTDDRNCLWQTTEINSSPQGNEGVWNPVTILEDGISLKNKHSSVKWIRRTLQLCDYLISRTGVTPARTLLLSQAALRTVITLDCWGKTTTTLLGFLMTQTAEQLVQLLLHPAALNPKPLAPTDRPCDHLVIAAL